MAYAMPVLLGDVCPMDRQKPEVWQQVMQVNVNRHLYTDGHCFLYYSSRSGSLVFTSSSVGRRGRAPTGAPMRPPSFATEGMMQVLAEEYQEPSSAG